MKKFKHLNLYQKSILLLMLGMTLIFSVIYPITISRVGFAYKGAILVPSQENGSTVYSGKLKGQPTRFTVSKDKTVVFEHGKKSFGPYTVKEDVTAIPKNEEMAEFLTGIELRQGDTILFRGGVLYADGIYWLYNEDGTVDNGEILWTTSAGFELDANGNVIDPLEPSAASILHLMGNPELTHKGDWSAWLFAVFVCVLNALSMLFADELFRWNLLFKIRNVDYAEPSDWEIAGRYITWTVLPLMALILFITGLQ